jgi:UDPglucose 6-dehydrogenase
MPEAKRRMGDRIRYAKDIYEAVDGADALLLVTEWKEFRLPDWGVVRETMRTPLLIDGRNIYDINELQELGFACYNIGR